MPDDIATVVVFLASGEANCIKGIILPGGGRWDATGYEYLQNKGGCYGSYTYFG